MKKKILSLLLIGIMVFSNTNVCLANESHIYEAKTSEKVSGKTALDAVEAGTGVIIDVRAQKRQDNFSLEDSISLPLFTVDENNKNVAINLQDGVTDDLEDNFNAYITAHKDELQTKTIYILCNSGMKGAENATTLLYAEGYDLNYVRTIENGAKDLDILDKAIGNSWDSKYRNFVQASDVETAIENDAIVIIDVRATKRYEAGHIKGSISLPLFTVNESDNNVVTTLYDDLATSFTSYITANKDTLSTKTIYILCNGGQSGARAALKLLLHAGYDFENIWTIQGGAGNDEVKPLLHAYDAKTSEEVSGKTALDAVEAGTGVIIDVRAQKRQDNFSLEDSISLPLFTVDANNKNVAINLQDGVTDDLEDNFNAYIKAHKDELQAKTIYILCNSGMKGAENATTLLYAAGYDLDNVRTIKNGAKDLDILDKAIGNSWDSKYSNFVQASDVKNAIGNNDIAIIDVRAAKRNEAGRIEGSISLPLFTVDANDKNVVTTLHDDLANAFTSYVTMNKDTLAKKQIYILCNGGQSGARAALKLLLHAGYDFENIWTIQGGAANEDIKPLLKAPAAPSAPSTDTLKPDTVQTGDASGTMVYLLTMGVAFTAFLAIYKRRFAKS